MQSLLASIQDLEGGGDQRAAFCAWLCGFLQQGLSISSVLTHPDMCLEDFLQPKVDSISGLILEAGKL